MSCLSCPAGPGQDRIKNSQRNYQQKDRSTEDKRDALSEAVSQRSCYRGTYGTHDVVSGHKQAQANGAVLRLQHSTGHRHDGTRRWADENAENKSNAKRGRCARDQCCQKQSRESREQHDASIRLRKALEQLPSSRDRADEDPKHEARQESTFRKAVAVLDKVGRSEAEEAYESQVKHAPDQPGNKDR